MSTIPLYRSLWQSGELSARADSAWRRLEACNLCSHECGVNRRESARGFCQNYDISHLRSGETVSLKKLSDIMVELQDRGCHSINLVTPTHFLPQILSAIDTACASGLVLPLVWNCGGYESQAALTLLDGVVDIYMPDVKFGDSEKAFRFTGAQGYWEAAKSTLSEMHRQVGDLRVDDNGVAYRGLIVRHLVLPANLAGTEEVLKFIAQELSPDTYVNIMAQYHPEHEAWRYPPLNRPVTRQEYREAVKVARKAGLRMLARPSRSRPCSEVSPVYHR